MDALVIASGAIAILRQAMEEIQRRVATGQISVEAQQEQIRKINAIRTGDFSGPEWQVPPSISPS